MGKETADRPSALRALGGRFELELARTFEWSGLATGPMASVPVRLDVLGVVVDKPLGEDAARVTADVEGRYADVGTMKVNGSGRVDFARRAVSGGAFDAMLGLDPSLVDRLSNSAVRVGTQSANVRLSATGLEVASDHEPSGLFHGELGGALSLSGGSASAMVNDLALDVTFPSTSRPGSLALSAKIDGAQARVQQSFSRIPTDFSDPVALGFSGSIEMAGLDPSFVARLAPATADRIGVLGRGPMRISVRNQTAEGALTAEFDVAAAALEARGAVSVAENSIALRGCTCDGVLTREAIVSMGLGEGIELEPGARYSLRVPAFSMARRDATVDATGDETGNETGNVAMWEPTGDIVGTATIQQLVVRRAPGLTVPLSIEQFVMDATYTLREERAAAKGTMTLEFDEVVGSKGLVGSNGGDGSINFDLTWRKPTEAKLFAGLEGSVEATALNLDRLVGSFGLEQDQVADVFGGPGNLRVAIVEREIASASISAEFPRLRSQLEATIPETTSGRVASAKGTVRADIAPAVFARLAGLGQETREGNVREEKVRRVTAPVTVELAIASLSVPFDHAWKPSLADASVAARGSVSPISMEVIDGRGGKSVVSTGALTLTLDTARVSDEIALKVVTSANANSQGSLDADAKLRGLFAETNPGAGATPIAVDARLAARAFPSVTLDALGATDGALGRYLGDTIDATLEAKLESKLESKPETTPGRGRAPFLNGMLKASLSSAYAKVEIPEVAISEGFARVEPRKPLTATFEMSREVREHLLSPINQIFADVSAGAPARFTLPRLAWPLDGDKRKLDAEFTLETGEVKMVNSGMLSWLLTVAQAGRSDGFEAFIEPLRATVSKGRLVYRDFALRAGKTTSFNEPGVSKQVGWKNSLVFAGDIDLGSTPMRAIALTTGVPLSDAGNWSSEARRLFESIGAASPELLKSLVVGVKLSGPLFDAQGKPAKLQQELAFPDLGDAIRQNPAGAIEAVGGIIDLFKKKDDKKKAPTKAPVDPAKDGAPPPKKSQSEAAN